jgi:colanic acid/amylovoran biosynthesis protein
MPVKILLSNLHSSHNIGDAALSQLALQEIRKNFPGCEIRLVMDEPQTYFGPEPVCASTVTWFKERDTQRFRWGAVPALVAGSVLAAKIYQWTKRAALWLVPPAQRAMLEAYFWADLVISSPGGFLYSSKSGLGLVNSLFSLAYASFAGKPFYLLAQSIGPFHLKWQYPLIRWVLRRARVIIVRETLSIEQMQKVRVNHPNHHILPDLAFLLATPSAPPERLAARMWLNEWGISPETDRPLLGVTTVNWSAQYPHFQHQAHYEQTLAETLEFFLKQFGGKVVFFPQVHGTLPGADDRVAAQRIAERLRQWGTSVVIIQSPQPYPVFKAAYGYMDLVIGTRMHSNIFAITEQVPVLAIGYQPKTLGIAKMAGIDEWVVDITQVNRETLCARLSALWAKRNEVRKQLQTRIPDLGRQAAQAVPLIAQDFDRWQQEQRRA